MANLLWQKHLGMTIPWWFIGLGEAAGAFSFTGGILLWREHRAGRVVSLVIQWLQILQVQVRRVGYLFVAGVQLSVTVPPNPYLFHVGFFRSISLRWHSTSASMVGGQETPQGCWRGVRTRKYARQYRRYVRGRIGFDWPRPSFINSSYPGGCRHRFDWLRHLQNNKGGSRMQLAKRIGNESRIGFPGHS